MKGICGSNIRGDREGGDKLISNRPLMDLSKFLFLDGANISSTPFLYLTYSKNDQIRFNIVYVFGNYGIRFALAGEHNPVAPTYLIFDFRLIFGVSAVLLLSFLLYFFFPKNSAYFQGRVIPGVNNTVIFFVCLVELKSI